MLAIAACALIGLPPLEVNPAITSVSMFKNGFSAIFREATIPGNEFYVMSPSPAVYGTFWVTASSGTTVKSIIATQVESDIETRYNTLDDILQANVGKKLTLSLKKTSEAEASVIEGELKSANGELVIVATSEGTRAFQKARILEIWSKSNDLVYSFKSKTSKDALKIEVEGNPNGKIYFMSIERGLTWAPIYNLDISDEKTLKFSTRATVLNDLADIDKAKCSFITGFPNLKFLTAQDPLTVRTSLSQFLGSIDQVQVDRNMGETRRGFGGGLQNQAPSMADMEQAFTPSTGQLEDLFFYPYPSLTLKKGDRGQFSLFEFKTEYQDIYSCSLPDATQSAPSPNDAPPEVWHKIRFKNESKMPISTGTASTMKGSQTIGQDILKYIPANDYGTLTITKALDLKVKQEAEVIKTEEVQRKSGDNILYFNRITVKVTMKAMNLQSKDAKLEVDEQIQGDVVANAPNLKAVKIPSLFTSESSGSNVTWSPIVPGGKTVQVEFTTVYQIPISR